MADLRRIATVSFSPPAPKEPGGVAYQAIREVVHAVAKDRPHFICFPEICASLGRDLSAAVREAFDLPPFVEEIGQLAREVNAALVVPLLERHAGRVFNSVPVIDSKGKLVLVYRKNYPTVGEMKIGMFPGTEVPVAECDGVRVGAAVCFDVNYPSVAEALERQRARIVFFPTMFPAGQLAQHWALRYGFYVALAHTGESAVIDMNGRYLIRQGKNTPQVVRNLLPPWAIAEVDVDRELIHLDYHQEKFPAIRAKYGPDVVIEVHHPEAFALITTRREGLTVGQVMKEFDIEPAAAYLRRSADHRNAVLASFNEHPHPPEA